MVNPVNADSGVLPLKGVTVVDLTQVLAGPFATMMLGDMGAEVIKIEPVGRGDRSRSFRPSPTYFDAVNRNKRSVAIDLKSEDGQEFAHRLLADADVFIESTKFGRPATYDLSYESVSETNPEIIYCSIAGFGHDSPYREVPAWDMLIQAMSGVMSMTGESDGPPLWSGLPSGDLTAGMYAAQSVLATLFARERGRIDGEWIEVPMLDALISWLTSRAGHSFGLDEPFPRGGVRHPSIAPFGVFECADERMVVAAATDSLWANLCAAIDRPDLMADERFEELADRVEHVDALTEELETVFGEHPIDEWLDLLQAHDVPAGPIHDTVSVWEDDHVRQRQLRQTMKREGRQDAEVIDHPVNFTELTTELAVAPQQVGESTDALLKRHGYDPAEIERLRDQDIVG